MKFRSVSSDHMANAFFIVFFAAMGIVLLVGIINLFISDFKIMAIGTGCILLFISVVWLVASKLQDSQDAKRIQ